MEQVAGVFRARYNRQAKVIRVQWLVILALLLALVFFPGVPPVRSKGSRLSCADASAPAGGLRSESGDRFS